MKIILKIVLGFLMLLAITIELKAQELPPIEKFTPEDYGGQNQNWMISQAPNNYIYVANSGGLLEFNGAKWQLYPSPNDTDIRAVKVVNDRIYIGCFKEFGYYKKDTNGRLKYHSLVQKLKDSSTDKSIDDENIWGIRSYEEWILFQTQERIYFYNTLNDSFKIIFSDNIITKVFNIKNTIYYHVTNEGIYKIEQGESKLIADDAVVKEDRVINIFASNNQLLVQTHKSGFFLIEDSKLLKWKTPANNFINAMSVFNSIQLEDGSFILGTISNGIIHLSSEGEILYQINQKNGLSNNTALSLFEDTDKNVWVGLDNGINCINIKSPVKFYHDEEGVLGTIYSSIIFNNYLYLGTNQGLFYKNLENTNDSFQFVKGTAGQVWNLFIFNDNELFCAHHNGTFIIDKGVATLIANTPGTWNIKPVLKKKNTLLQGNYNGLYILEKEKGTWVIKNKIEGFDNSARYFEIDNRNQVWISHGYKGIFKLELDNNLTNTISVSLEPNLSIGKNSSLIKYKNNILYAYEEGLFKYDTIHKNFVYDSILSPLIEKKNYMSGKLVVDQNEKLWAFSKENINYLTTDNVTNKPKINQISIPSYLRKGMIGYENISLIKDEKYLLGIANGYITIDLSQITEVNEYIIMLNSIALRTIESTNMNVDLHSFGEFDYTQNSVVFNFSVPEYDKYKIVKYQYKLTGHYDKWSEWTEKSDLVFENLPFGDYNFKIRAKIGNKLTNNVINYDFRINRPWYLSNTAILVYLLLLLGITLITHKAYKGYYRKQHEHKQLESEQLIIRIKNEKLNEAIENKNRELAISTMSIIKKNEVLGSIKKELKNNHQSSSNNNAVIRLIDSNINNTKDWKFFEEAFNNVDKDFLDKVKKSYPELTPNDLRFCAYLRLNLSSKEIAPLLNISVRSVETKRYRLRKRMNLDHDKSLVNHILQI